MVEIVAAISVSGFVNRWNTPWRLRLRRSLARSPESTSPRGNEHRAGALPDAPCDTAPCRRDIGARQSLTRLRRPGQSGAVEQSGRCDMVPGAEAYYRSNALTPQWNFFGFFA